MQGEPGSTLHAVQVYTKGELCSLTGTERLVHVRFFCSEDPTHIRAIEEIVSCQYVIVVGTPAMCSEVLGTIQSVREKVKPLPVLLSTKHDICGQVAFSKLRRHRIGWPFCTAQCMLLVSYVCMLELPAPRPPQAHFQVQLWAKASVQVVVEEQCQVTCQATPTYFHICNSCTALCSCFKVS
jgi:hypothetical protein